MLVGVRGEPTSPESVPFGRRGVSAKLRQGIDELRPVFGVFRAFDPTAGDGRLNHPQTDSWHAEPAEEIATVETANRKRAGSRAIGRPCPELMVLYFCINLD
jgi:hypothetical protein